MNDVRVQGGQQVPPKSVLVFVVLCGKRTHVVRARGILLALRRRFPVTNRTVCLHAR